MLVIRHLFLIYLLKLLGPEKFLGLLAQLRAKIGMSDLNKGHCPFPLCFSVKMGDSVFCHHNVCQGSWHGHDRAFLQLRHNTGDRSALWLWTGASR